MHEFGRARIPRKNRPWFLPFHNKPAKQIADKTASPAEAMREAFRSAGVRALNGVVPSRLSTGVRNQNNDSAAAVNSSSGNTERLDAAPTATPVNIGTSRRPHAPCSRGISNARIREG